MNIQKFTYRAPGLREPLSKCLEFLKSEQKKLSDEINKYKQVHADNPYDFSEVDRNRVQNIVLRHKNIGSQIKRFELWLNECNKRGWFTKYVLDENDLSELYQYKFIDPS